jgi:hypothetical protein
LTTTRPTESRGIAFADERRGFESRPGYRMPVSVSARVSRAVPKTTAALSRPRNP